MGHSYCSSDWHGAGWAWGLVKKFLQPDDKLYFLGDACDRTGVDGGWNMLKELLTDEQICYILGNHDKMLIDAIRNPENYDIRNLYFWNSGQATFDAATEDPWARKWIAMLARQAKCAIYTRPDGKTVYMSHTGSTDSSDEDFYWDRDSYVISLNYTNYDYVVHGHTRPQHIIRDLRRCGKEPPAYNSGAYQLYPWRWVVDCGTVLSNQVVLLDLDTFEQHIFKKD